MTGLPEDSSASLPDPRGSLAATLKTGKWSQRGNICYLDLSYTPILTNSKIMRCLNKINKLNLIASVVENTPGTGPEG